MLNLLLALPLLSPAAHAASPFGGAELAFTGEFDGSDTAPAEMIVDLDVRPLQVKRTRLTLTWVPAELGWGIVPAENRLDHVAVAVMQGRNVFASEKTAAYWKLGELRYDNDADYVDLMFGGGGVELMFLEDLLKVRLGGDVRLRTLDTTISQLFDDEPNTWSLLLGVPVGVHVQKDELAGPLYASGDLALRPGVGLVGPQAFAFDTTLRGEGGLLLVDEEEVNLRIFLGYQMHFDTFTNLPYAGMVHSIGLGGRARF
ncbi:MAG: hypothetical protein H6739_24290 [Alphaproteobacteria bacterium]|nr:hypothetical protein [Alphaproteobacteria bacterium]